jgi:hypothetical protein
VNTKTRTYDAAAAMMRARARAIDALRERAYYRGIGAPEAGEHAASRAIRALALAERIKAAAVEDYRARLGHVFELGATLAERDAISSEALALLALEV